MTKFEQAYVTHCTFNTSFYHQEPLDRGGDRTYEYTTRAGSFDRGQGLGFYQKFRSVAYYRNYRPQGANDDDLRQMTYKDFPVRFAFLPDTGGYDLLIHACYRGSDTSKSRRAQSFFVHMLYQHRGTTKAPSTLVARQVLPLWGSTAWVNEDSDDLNVQLPTCEQLSDFATPAADHFERTLHSFVTVQLQDEVVDPRELIPNRWKHASLEARQNLIRALLRGYLGIATQGRVSLIVVAEPEFAAFLFYAVARLLPQKGFAASLSFSTFELTTDTFFPCKLVGTTSESPETTQFTNRTGGPILNTFTTPGFTATAELTGKETAFEKSVFNNVALNPDEWLSRVDEDLKHIENAAPQSAAELDPSLDSARIIRELLRPRENSNVAIPESKDQRAYIARTVAPHISELFQGSSLTNVMQNSSLFAAYVACLEETHHALTPAAAQELGHCLGDKKEAIRLCTNNLLNITTRLDILAAFVESRDNAYLGLKDQIPPEKALAPGSSPVVQEIFSRISQDKLRLFMRSILHVNKSLDTLLMLAAGLAASTRPQAEKILGVQDLVRLLTKEHRKRVSARSGDCKPESQLSDFLLYCVKHIPQEEKADFLCAAAQPDQVKLEINGSTANVFRLLADAAKADPDFKEQMNAAIRHTLFAEDTGFNGFLDRITTARALMSCLEDRDSVVGWLTNHCKLMSELKTCVEKMLEHRGIVPGTLGKSRHAKQLEEFTFKVICRTRDIIEHDHSREDVGYFSSGKDTASAVTLGNIFFAGLDPKEVTRVLNRLASSNSGYGKLASFDLQGRPSQNRGGTGKKKRGTSKQDGDAGLLQKLRGAIFSRWFLMFVLLSVSVVVGIRLASEIPVRDYFDSAIDWIRSLPRLLFQASPESAVNIEIFPVPPDGCMHCQNKSSILNVHALVFCRGRIFYGFSRSGALRVSGFRLLDRQV